MRIAYITTHLGQTGVNNVLLDLVTLFTRNQHQCVVYYFKSNHQPMCFPCVTIKLKGLGDKIDFNHFDVVHSHTLLPDIYVALHKPWHCKALCISTVHCYVFADFHDLYGKVKGTALAFVYLLSKLRHNKIVTLSQHAMHYYAKFYPKHKLTFAYNTRNIDKHTPLTPEELLTLETFKADGKLLGMNCVLIFRKGIDTALQALSLLPPQYKLFVVGDGPHKQHFQTMAKHLNLSQRVYFAGNRLQAHRYLPYYDIYALPSRAEGFPLALLEAAAYQKQVVCSRLPIIQEAFTTDEVAFFDIANPQQMANAVLNLTPQHGVNLGKRFEKSYCPTLFYQRYHDIYNE